MRKKLLLSLIIAVAAFALAFGFAGCDLFGSDGGDSGEHVHTARKYEAKEATCSKEGNSEYWYCNTCGRYFADEACETPVTVKSTIIPKAAHKEVIDPAVPATCTTDGKTEGKHCSECKEVIVAQKTVPAAHTEVIDHAVPATCTTDGKTEGKHCSECSAVLIAQKTVPAAHTEVIDPAVPKTCTTDGKTEGKHCSVCDTVLTAQTTVPAGHTEVIDPAVPAGCRTDGKTEGKHCSMCNTVLVPQNRIEAQGHFEEIDEGYPATCTATGLTDGKHCINCKQITQPQQLIPASGHTEVTVPAVAATCTSTGLTEGKKCSVCGTVTVQQNIVNSTGHSGSGKLCSSCGDLLVAPSEGLTFAEVTATRAGARSAVNIIGFEVTGRGSCTDTDIIIPATHNGLPVLGIGGGAFYEDATIRSVTLPNGVKYIESAAFCGCENLTEANLADSIERIEDSTFRETALTFFKCPASLKSMGGKMLVACMDLQTVIINTITEKWNYQDIMSSFLANCSLTDIYYEGTRVQWDTVTYHGDTYHEDASLYGSTPYPAYDVIINFYSETRPTAAGNYWHYDASGNPVKW